MFHYPKCGRFVKEIPIIAICKKHGIFDLINQERR